MVSISWIIISFFIYFVVSYFPEFKPSPLYRLPGGNGAIIPIILNQGTYLWVWKIINVSSNVESCVITPPSIQTEDNFWEGILFRVFEFIFYQKIK